MIELNQMPACSKPLLSGVRVINGDCLEVMKLIPDGIIDMVLCDLPYGTTACKWDTIIPFDALWKEYERLIKPNGAILLFGQEPFSSSMRLSNIKDYKFDIIWNKKFASNFAQAKKRPMNIQENICVFYKKQPTYNPNMTKRDKPIKATSGSTFSEVSMVKNFNSIENKVYDFKYPESIVLFPRILGTSKEKTGHPTQKPVSLFEYLIKTYTNEGDLVLDNTAGSGTTGIACINTNRKYILIEKEEKYFDIINERIANHTQAK
jgi:DNA modification methylase